MGVSITAYSNVEFVQSQGDTTPNQEEEFYGRDQKMVNLYGEPHFTAHTDGLEDGWYKYEDSFDIMTRSYGGYGNWRREVAKTIYGEDFEIETLWDNAEEYVERPFFWVLHFSDCEGFIGPEKCKILLEDFQAHKEALDSHFDATVDFWKEGFIKEWITALEAVAGNGVVSYG